MRGVRRAGLDYHELAAVSVHRDFATCLRSLSAGRTAAPPRWFALTTRGTVGYDTVRYAPGDVVVFGPETRGLPGEMLTACPEERRLRIPMQPGARSLNLSNAVAIVVYEAWRQSGWTGVAR